MFPVRDTIPSQTPPLMTWALIGANCAVFLLELAMPAEQLQAMFYWFGVVPARYTHPDWAVWLGLPVDNYWPFLTSMFLHGGWLHIISNMWTLWIFGDNVEDRMGPWRFLVFYLLCGVIAGVVHWVTNLHSTVPTIGASGAISGVLGAYFLLYPRAHIITLIPLFFYPLFVALPAATFALIWFFTQLFSGVTALLGPGQVGGVAWWAHIGGFIAGMALCKLFLDPNRRRRYKDEMTFESAWDVELVESKSKTD
ncbi:MAG TPA: rhomboid family intramembrane serine protease [Methylothermaceae bacterium]|nr:rhomboid family intramembrane serine protease [Methylothermaceae bacterium]